MTTKQKFSRTWWVLLAGPLLFIAGILVMSVYYGFATQGQNVDAIPGLVAASTPYQLVVIQVLVLVIVTRAMKRDGLSWAGIGWRLEPGQSLAGELLRGVIPGAVLALLYIFVLSPLLAALQKVWDYVPAGELLTTLGASLVPFVVADVFLAPFVEESIYRGYGFVRLLERFGMPAAIGISMFFFGILHWTGGFWYILLVGLAAGGLFTWLRVSRKNLAAPFAAHLALNLIETIYVILISLPKG